jgi:rSAM/selenodomain-associated transferase 2
MPKLSIIIPTLNEASGIVDALARLQPLRSLGHEVILVDGGSRDLTTSRAAPLVDRLLTAARGRALQMNAGAASATGDVLVFLHADTSLPSGVDGFIEQALTSSVREWGRFDVAIGGRHPLLRVVAWFMNLRSRRSGIATGDQAIFVRRATFARVGGFPELALMEDIALCDLLKRESDPVCLRARVVTSGRRWGSRGVVRTIALMWRLRLAFWLGASPERLSRSYPPDVR